MRSKFKWIFTLLVAFTMQFSFAQEKTVTGVVSDELGPIAGANIVVKGTTNGTTTDFDGNFSISAKQGDVLLVSYLGKKTSEVAVGSSSVVNVTLQEDILTGGEVVVTGALGIKRKADEVTSSYEVVKAEQITQAQNPNVVQSLTAKVSGLQINTTSNGVNPESRIQIRGAKSLTGDTQALVVIDGSISTATILNTIDPAAIESVNVLKGAQGAALYGSQGVNGVVVVTTKRGNKSGDKFSISVGTSMDFENVSFLPERQTRYGAGWNGVYYSYENGGWGPEFNGTIQPVGLPQADGSYIYEPYSSLGSDNIKGFFKTGTVSQSRVSLSAGDQDSYLYFSADKTLKDFVVNGDQLDKKSFLFKAGKKLGKFSVDGNVNYINYKTSQASSFLYYYLMQTPTNVPVQLFENSGNAGAWSQYVVNPYWTIDNDRNGAKNNIVSGTVRLQYDLNKNINVVYNANARLTQQDAYSYANEYIDTRDIYDMSTASDFSNNNYFQRYIYGDLLINFDYMLTDKLNLKVNLGNNIQDTYSTNVGVGGTNLVVGGLYNIGNIAGNPLVDGNNTFNRTSRMRAFSFFGNVDLGYDDYLFLNVTGRNDWTSILDKDNNNYFYPSVGLSFVPTKAFEGLRGDILNYLKLSANYTKVGKPGSIGAYDINRLYGSATGYPFNGQASYLQSTTLTDPKIKPEFYTTTEFNVNAGFFNDRLTLDGSVYKSINNDLITGISPSYTSGFTSAVVNIGETETKGFEIDLGFTPIDNKEIGLKWTNKLSYSTYETIVNKVSDQQNSVALNTGYNTSANSNVGIYAEEGEVFPLIKGTAYQRDDQGRVIIDASTGMPLITSDYKKLGKATPDYILGYNTSIQYKGLRLSATMDYRTGHQFYSQTKQTISTFGYLVESAEGGRVGFVYPNSVITTGTPGVYAENTSTLTGGTTYTEFQEYYSANFNEVAENFVLDASAFKVREIALSYTLPKKLIENVGFDSVVLGVNARNPFIVLPKENRGYADPETSVTTSAAAGYAYTGQYPTTRTFGFSVNFTF